MKGGTMGNGLRSTTILGLTENGRSINERGRTAIERKLHLPVGGADWICGSDLNNPQLFMGIINELREKNENIIISFVSHGDAIMFTGNSMRSFINKVCDTPGRTCWELGMNFWKDICSES